MKNFTLTRLIIPAALAAGLIITCGREGPVAPDVDPPVISSTSPYYLEQNVPVNAGIKITFSEAMDASSLIDGSIKVVRGDAAVSGTVSCSGAVVTFTPSANLSPNSTYTVTISSGVKDLAGNAMVAPYPYSFTTAASEPAPAPVQTHTVTAKVSGGGGSISPASVTVNNGGTATFTLKSDEDFHVQSVTGCGGNLSGSGYITGAVTADCTVTASFAADAPATHTVLAIAGDGGRVEPSGTISGVQNGKSITFRIDADRGYRIVSPVGGDCGGTLGNSDDDKTTYTTNPIVADCTVKFTFSRKEPTATPLSGEHGRLIPGTPRLVHYEECAIFSVEPDPAAPLPGLIGETVPAQSRPAGHGAVTAAAIAVRPAGSATTAAGGSITVTPSPGSNGKIIPAEPQLVAYNGVVTFTIIPARGYSISFVAGCDGVLVNNTYTTGPITSDCTVTAVFNKNISI